jgi:hypothetical protein
MIDPNDHTGLNKKGIRRPKPSLKLNMKVDDDEKTSSLALTPTSYKEIVFTLEGSMLATEDEKGVYSSNKIRFSFDIIDIEGQLIQASFPACSIPKLDKLKTTVHYPDADTVRQVELPSMETNPKECNKSIQLL